MCSYHQAPNETGSAALAGRTTATTLLQASPALAPLAGLDNIQHRYNDLFSCPLTPFENRLKVPIRAGEKVFGDATHG
jgi:uncharacterized protein DUF1684